MNHQPQQTRSSPEHAPLSGRAPTDAVRTGISLLQLNAEGLTKAKVILIEHLLQSTNATAILLQETHVSSSSRLKIPGYTLAAYTESDTHGIATFVHNSAKWRAVAASNPDSDLEWAATQIEGVTVINVYKPPTTRLLEDSIPFFDQPCMYAGDFNCQSTTWGYRLTTPDGSALEDWASASGVHLLYDPKEPDSFHSGRWNTSTNPDLAFVNLSGPSPHRSVLDPFPKSQHRPSLIVPDNPVTQISSRPVKRWNFRKANWNQFKDLVDAGTDDLPLPANENLDRAYAAFCKLLINSAKRTVPRGFRQRYIPTWDDDCDKCYDAFLHASSDEESATLATELTICLDKKRRERWDETVQGIDFTHSSRRAWSTLNRLTGRSSRPKHCPVTANSIAQQLLANGSFKNADKDHTRKVKQEASSLWNAPGVDGLLSKPFNLAELMLGISQLKCGKAQGPDNIPPEFLKHCGPKCLSWLCDFYSTCLAALHIPKIWRKSAVVALLKPNKPADNPKSYRPISLLCVPFKLLERLLLARLNPVVDPQLPDEQAGFRHGRCTTHQIVKLTDDIEESFEKGKKAGAVLVDLTAAYDTVWHHGLILKLLRTIPDRHLVRFLATLLANRSFLLKTSDGQTSRPRRLRNGVPQGSVLSPLLFNIYISDLPRTASQQYGYADDLALLYTDKSWSRVENVLTSDMELIADYLQTWRLKLSVAKTTVTPFHLNTKEANRELTVLHNGERLPNNPHPTYLGVKLDRQLTYRQHLEALRAKVSARNNLLRRLAGTSWGASTSTLRTGALALVFSTAEYAAQAWCRSTHCKKLDRTLNDTLRLITGCLRPTPTHLLPVLAGIAPPGLRRENLTDKLTNKSLAADDHPLHKLTSESQHLGRQRLRSRRPFSRHAAALSQSDFSVSREWEKSWEATTRPRQFTVSPGTKAPAGSKLPRKNWVTLNRLRTGVGRFNANMYRWGLRESSACVCGAEEQTADHIIYDCPVLHPPNEMTDLSDLCDVQIQWLNRLQDVA